MIVLGINGFQNEHDPSAALLIDGKIAGFAEEERFSRVKRACGAYPHNAVRWLLHENQLTIDDIDLFAFGWNIPEMISQGVRYEFEKDICDDNAVVRIVTGQNPKKKAKIVYVPHHLAHAAASFYASGFSDAVALVLDGRGENEAITCYKVKNGQVSLLRKWNIAFSLGFLYEAASFYSGFTDWDAGKTMGLASYAYNPKPLLDFMRWEKDEIVLFDRYTQYTSTDMCDKWLSKLCERFGPRNELREAWNPLTNRYHKHILPEDLKTVSVGAGAIQETLVDVLQNLVRYCVEQTGIKNVCLSGGVSLNCAANGRLLDLCEGLYVFPAANDAGVSYGAAAWVATQNGDVLQPVRSALTGPAYASETIKAMLDSYGVKYEITKDAADAVSDFVLDGKIVGWFHGNMEMGPRALGARSILADPRGTPHRDCINHAKSREYWRPFAPSLLAEERQKFFKKDVISRFMLKAVECRDEIAEKFPNIAHVDNTSRPHTVLPEDGPYHDLLTQMRKKTGDGIILNTSFNGAGEPIVCSPLDALRSFYSTGIDVLNMNEFIVKK